MDKDQLAKDWLKTKNSRVFFPFRLSLLGCFFILFIEFNLLLLVIYIVIVIMLNMYGRYRKKENEKLYQTLITKESDL